MFSEEINRIREEFDRVVEFWDINNLSSPVLVEKALKTERLLGELAANNSLFAEILS